MINHLYALGKRLGSSNGSLMLQSVVHIRCKCACRLFSGKGCVFSRKYITNGRCKKDAVGGGAECRVHPNNVLDSDFPPKPTILYPYPLVAEGIEPKLAQNNKRFRRKTGCFPPATVNRGLHLPLTKAVHHYEWLLQMPLLH